MAAVLQLASMRLLASPSAIDAHIGGSISVARQWRLPDRSSSSGHIDRHGIRHLKVLVEENARVRNEVDELAPATQHAAKRCDVRRGDDTELFRVSLRREKSHGEAAEVAIEALLRYSGRQNASADQT